MHIKMNTALYEASLKLNNEYPFYSEILLQTNFIENKEIKSIGVRVTKKGLQMIYNPEWIDSIGKNNLCFVLIHEVYHFLHHHSLRDYKKNHFNSNVIMDMIINTLITEYTPFKKEQVEEIGALFIPTEYNGKKIFELLYEWIEDRQLPKGYSQDGQDGQIGQELPEDIKEALKKRKSLSEKTKKLIDSLTNTEEEMTIDVHMEDEVDNDMKKQIIDDIIQECKIRGVVKGNDECLLKQLRASKKDYTKKIRRKLSGIVGGSKHLTWAKPNRKGLPFKGFKKYTEIINVILDVSGSMCGEFEKVLSTLFRNNININLIQVDSEVQKVNIINNKKQLSSVNIKGLGGTTLQPGVNYIKKNFNKYNNVILTDGYCDQLNFYGIRGKTLVLTTAKKIETINGKNVSQIFINKEGY